MSARPSALQYIFVFPVVLGLLWPRAFGVLFRVEDREVAALRWFLTTHLDLRPGSPVIEAITFGLSSAVRVRLEEGGRAQVKVGGPRWRLGAPRFDVTGAPTCDVEPYGLSTGQRVRLRADPDRGAATIDDFAIAASGSPLAIVVFADGTRADIDLDRTAIDIV